MITNHDIQSYSENYGILARADDYIYLLPHPELRNWISNYTITFPNKDIISDDYTVIPHGCSTLVFSCSNNDIKADLFGPATAPCIVGEECNKFSMLLIIEFQPAGLYMFSGITQRELSDKVFLFEQINPVLNKVIVNTIEKAKSVWDLIFNLNKILLSNLKTTYPSEFRSAVGTIIQNAGNISAKDLSSSTFYSTRHLNRIFDEYLGMSTKAFSRLVRMNKAIRLLDNPHNSLLNVHNVMGYYDLSHFIHDFKSICGITPQEYRNNMSDFYSEIAKF